MTENSKEITGEKLKRFMTRYDKRNNTDKYYDTEQELCDKHGLDVDNLYTFLWKSGRLERDASHREANYDPAGYLEFGPLVKANGTINYYFPYWRMLFNDPKHKSNLQDCIARSAKTEIQTVAQVTTKPKSKAKDIPEYRYEFLNKIFMLADDKLAARDLIYPSKPKRFLENKSGRTSYGGGKEYDIENLKTALREKKNYCSRPIKEKIVPIVAPEAVKTETGKPQFVCGVILGYTPEGKLVINTKINSERDNNSIICAMLDHVEVLKAKTFT